MEGQGEGEREEGRAWGWNLEEMRNAATMEEAGQAYRYPVISGFTPVNPSDSKGAATQPVNADNATVPKAERKPKSFKIRKTQPSTLPKRQKAAGRKRSQNEKTAQELQCQDISMGLSRTKPRPSGENASFVKTAAPPELVLSEPKYNADLLRDAWADFEEHKDSGPAHIEEGPSGFADQYRTACAHRGDAGVSLHEGNIEFPDYRVHTSAHPLQIDFEMAFNSDEIFGDQEADEFPMNEEDLEDFIHSFDPVAKHHGATSSDWQTQELDDDFALEEPGANISTDRTMHASSYPQSELVHASLPKHHRKDTCSDEDGLDDVFHQYSRVLSPVLENAVIAKADHALGDEPEGADGCFDDDELDDDLADLTADGSDTVMSLTPLTSPVKPPPIPTLQWMPPKAYTPVTPSQTPCSPIEIPKEIPVDDNGAPIPFTRPPFPKPVRDRSPILGLINRTVLRTCFRIGEALNAAAVASRTNTDAIVELYARIVLSEREINGGFKQFFQFGDLFTDKPPYLSGTYSLWKGVDLWDVDSKPFVGAKGRGKMARVMGRIKRREQGGGCEMVVLSIWEVDWEDVGVAKGIVCS